MRLKHGGELIAQETQVVAFAFVQNRTYNLVQAQSVFACDFDDADPCSAGVIVSSLQYFLLTLAPIFRYQSDNSIFFFTSLQLPAPAGVHRE